jgi:hypothetical protein
MLLLSDIIFKSICIYCNNVGEDGFTFTEYVDNVTLFVKLLRDVLTINKPVICWKSDVSGK